MPEPNPTAGRWRRPTRWLVAGTFLVALVCGTGCGDSSTTTTGAAGGAPPAKGQQQPGPKNRIPK